MDRSKVHLTVSTRESVLYDDDVETVSSVNDKGVFDVLEQHSNFISLIRDKLVIKLSDGEEREMSINEGIMRVNKDQVSVFLGLGH